jgi:hypothetical protein
VEFRGEQMALQSKKLATKCKTKLKMWHAHTKINRNCGYKNYFQGELNPKSKWTLPIATKDGLVETLLLVNTYQKKENAYIVITNKEMNGKFIQHITIQQENHKKDNM